MFNCSVLFQLNEGKLRLYEKLFVFYCTFQRYGFLSHFVCFPLSLYANILRISNNTTYNPAKKKNDTYLSIVLFIHLVIHLCVAANYTHA